MISSCPFPARDESRGKTDQLKNLLLVKQFLHPGRELHEAPRNQESQNNSWEFVKFVSRNKTAGLLSEPGRCELTYVTA